MYGDIIYGGVRYGDIGSSGYQQSLTDTITINDSRQAAYGKLPMSTLTLTDNIGSSADFIRAFPDTLSFSDAPVKSSGKPLADTLVFADTSYMSSAGYIVDTILFSDLDVKAFNRNSSDTISIADSSAKNTGKSVSDSTGLIDAIAKLIGEISSDSIAFVDSTPMQAGKVLSDAITYVDNEVGTSAYYRSITDTISATDSFSVQLILLYADTLSLLDNCVKVINPGVFNWQKNLSDTFGLSDAMSKIAGKVLSEGISFTDISSKAIGSLLADIISHLDSFGKAATYHRTIPDIIAFDDLRTVQYAVLLENTIVLSDVIGFNLPNVNWVIGLTDNFSLSDAVGKIMGKSFDDSVSLSEVIVKGTFKLLNDNLSLLHVFSPSVMYYRLFENTLSLIDANNLTSAIKYIIKVYFQLRTNTTDFLLGTPSTDFHLMEVE